MHTKSFNFNTRKRVARMHLPVSKSFRQQEISKNTCQLPRVLLSFLSFGYSMRIITCELLMWVFAEATHAATLAEILSISGQSMHIQ